MREIRYRRAEAADVPSLALLPGQGEPGGAADKRMLPYLLGQHHPQQALGPPVMWMALDGELPIGYIAGHLTRRFDCDGELQYLYVLPAHRGGEVRRACFASLRADSTRHAATELRKHWLVWEDIGAVLGSSSSTEPG